MCGIAGWAEKTAQTDEALIKNMCDALIHRGPDDTDIYLSGDRHVALGHRRLSLLDLSSSGRQPMCDASGLVCITFNGEIYNYLELKQQLQSGYTFVTHTDTEVILAAYRKWGMDMLQRLKGMFAFALLDEEKQVLFLVRDRFGIKPLYYSLADSRLVFASELKAIFASGKVEKEMDFTAFADYFVYRYVPSPKTIWKNIKKLAPAEYIQIDLRSYSAQSHTYWTLHAEKHTNLKLVQEVDSIIKQSVEEHTRADIELGAFLSGGYDSSAIVSYMKKIGQSPKTFSLGFKGWEASEHAFAKIVADQLGLQNESMVVGAEKLDLLDIMPDVYDEPIADISIIPTYLISELASRHVKAVLGGEGADEIFVGYTWQHNYFRTYKPTSFVDVLKKKIVPRDPVAFYADAMGMGVFDNQELGQMLHSDYHRYIADDVHWFYRQHTHKDMGLLKSIQYLDMKCFMGELVLTKVDRASMAHSLEVRVPFLDHTLYEKIFSVREKDYFDPNQTKMVLYENLKQVLPPNILSRKKQGFVGPDSYYMDMNWYRRQLADSALVKFGIINKSYLNQLLAGSYDWKLWKIVVMEKWFKKWMT